jgi:hypothetical protein
MLSVVYATRYYYTSNFLRVRVGDFCVDTVYDYIMCAFHEYPQLFQGEYIAWYAQKCI